MGSDHAAASAAEARGAVRWLLAAGGLAVLFSCILFWADDTVMGGARDRDIEHNKQLLQVRSAQSSLASSVNDPRQLLPLTIESDKGETNDHSGHASPSGH